MDAVLKKVVAAFGPSEIVALVKAVVLAKSDVVAIIRTLAQRQRHPGESPAQAFARFITRDPDGIKLYRILKSMPGSEIVPFGKGRSTLGRSGPRPSAFAADGGPLAWSTRIG